MRTNAPRTITLLLAALFTAVGITVVFFNVPAVDRAFADLVAATGLNISVRDAAWGTLLASPILIIIGSLFRHT